MIVEHRFGADKFERGVKKKKKNNNYHITKINTVFNVSHAHNTVFKFAY